MRTLLRWIRPARRSGAVPPPLDPAFRYGAVEDEFRAYYDRCRPYTMTTALELYNLFLAVRHVVRAGVPGAFVECGVWKGGSAMMAALTLLGQNQADRHLFLYDTYEGMPEASAHDVTHEGRTAAAMRQTFEKLDGGWNVGTYEEVKKNLASTGYPVARVVFARGLVESTIPQTVPEAISILRLDTDFYESTLHELKHLYPRLSPGGVLIVDDYDYWRGSRKAVDEYFERNDIRMLLFRMDVGRMGIKP